MRKRPIGVARKRKDLTVEKLNHLLLGVDLCLNGYTRQDGSVGREGMRRDWEEVREDAIAYWSKAPGWLVLRDLPLWREAVGPDGPGHRPGGWWLFDAPEATRRRLGGTGEPIGGEGTTLGLPNAYHRGYDYEDTPEFETEREYLGRHGLLMEHEQREAK